MKADIRACIEGDVCFVCGMKVQDGGCGWPDLRIVTHQGDCAAAVDQESRDFSSSRCGRWRPRADVLRRLRALRALRQVLAELAPSGSCA